MRFHSSSIRARVTAALTAAAILAAGFPLGAAAASAQFSNVNDPGFSANPRDIDKAWGLVRSGFPDAWDTGRGSLRTVVAVIDTGVDETHEDLRGVNFAEGYDFLNNRSIPVGSNSDDNGHGTFIAGILGAVPNNGIGVAGTNWQVTLMPIKALGGNGEGDVAVLARAITWAADHGAGVINLSVGGLGIVRDSALAGAVSYAFGRGSVIVAAAGNDRDQGARDLDRDPVYPVCNDNDQNMVIGVSAVDVNDLKVDVANYGAACVDVVAPGKRILSTIDRDPVTGQAAPNSYAYASGTSVATAFVAGLAALLRSTYPSLTPAQVRDRILLTAESVDSANLSQCGGSSCRGLLGRGRIRAAAALAAPSPAPGGLADGDVVRAEGQPTAYLISGGTKRPISPPVFNARFGSAVAKTVSEAQLAGVPTGPYVTPAEGTLVKLANSPTVYAIDRGTRRPVSGTTFRLRGFKFSDIKIAEYAELNSWPQGSFLLPPDGMLLRTPNRTVYWVVAEELHPVTREFFTNRGLNLLPVTAVSERDVRSYPVGETFR